MCGICGMISKYKIDEEDRSLVEKMNDRLKHRGPDDSGYFENNNVALAHRRLSIIDLSDLGHQPMNYLNRYTIIFNGEIYNYLELRDKLQKAGYSFHSRTDTEVIMAAFDYWKFNCFKYFNGMWAFALFDNENKQVILSRDRFGIKPLYYHKSENRLLFASEIKALLCDCDIKRIANAPIVYDYLLRGIVDHTNETFFENIYKIPAGTYCIIDESCSVKPLAYHKLTFSYKLEGECNDVITSKFKHSFDEALKYRLRSDVPVGSCLSGGLDSSAIVCGISNLYKDSHLNKKQYTFSYCADDKSLDESKYMQEVIKYAQVHPFFVSPSEDDLIKDLDKLIFTQDEPFLSTGIYASYAVYQKASNEGLKVLLDGQGADEFLCGYRKSRIYYLKLLLQNHLFKKFIVELFLSSSQIKSSLFVKSSLKNDIFKIKKILRGTEKGTFIDAQYFNTDFLRKTKGYGYNPRDGFQYNDVYKISLPSLLRYADRNSMAFSIESRLPFLDVGFTELCASLPLTLKIKNGYSKFIMRKSLDMPEMIYKRKDKIGFSTPEDKWILHGDKFYRTIFERSLFHSRRFINNEVVVHDWDAVIQKNKIPYIFRLICLEKWMEIFDVE